MENKSGIQEQISLIDKKHWRGCQSHCPKNNQGAIPTLGLWSRDQAISARHKLNSKPHGWCSRQNHRQRLLSKYGPVDS